MTEKFRIGTAFVRMKESDKIAMGLYPNYDRETLTRKVRSVMGGHLLPGAEVNLTPRQWREVMDRCAQEYAIRGLRPFSSAGWDRLTRRFEALHHGLQNARDWARYRHLFPPAWREVGDKNLERTNRRLFELYEVTIPDFSVDLETWLEDETKLMHPIRWTYK